MHMNYFQKYLLKFTNVFGWHIHMFDLQEMLRLFIFNKRFKKKKKYIYFWEVCFGFSKDLSFFSLLDDSSCDFLENFIC
jgi:hypothetical protein